MQQNASNKQQRRNFSFHIQVRIHQKSRYFQFILFSYFLCWRFAVVAHWRRERDVLPWCCCEEMDLIACWCPLSVIDHDSSSLSWLLGCWCQPDLWVGHQSTTSSLLSWPASQHPLQGTQVSETLQQYLLAISNGSNNADNLLLVVQTAVHQDIEC